MRVPETAMNENYFPMAPEDQVRASRQPLGMKPVPIAEGANDAIDLFCGAGGLRTSWTAKRRRGELRRRSRMLGRALMVSGMWP